MAEREMQYGELTVAFTTDYQWLYQDSGSGGAIDGSFWRPIAPPGFKPVGDFVRRGYNNPTNDLASVVVKSGPAVSPPVDYQEVWNDRKSGGKYDGSCWKPIPPAGFRALGYVCNSGYGKPPLNAIFCVRNDLCQEGTANEMIWDDHGSGATLCVSTWRTSFETGRYAGMTDRIFLAPNTFVAWKPYGQAPQPGNIDGIWILCLPQKVTKNPTPAAPKLTSATHSPESSTKATPVSSVIVPFTALNDPYRSMRDKVTKTAFYTIERKVSHKLLQFYANNSDIETTETTTTKVGISKQNSEKMTTETGIKLSQEVGFSVKGIAESKTTLELSFTLGYERSTVSTWSTETEHKVETKMAKRSATGVWIEQDIIEIRRADNTIVSTLAFTPDSTKVFKDQIPLNI